MERLNKIAANPFLDWSYPNINANMSSYPVHNPPMVSIPKDPMMQADLAEVRNRRKRPITPNEPPAGVSEPKQPAIQSIPRDTRPEHMPLEEFYYATMQPDKQMNGKENKIAFTFKVSVDFQLKFTLYTNLFLVIVNKF